MNRMDIAFEENKKKGRGSIALYYPTGDSLFEGKDVEWAGKYFACGCDCLEISLPYENPILDGPSVRDSMLRALKNVTLEDVFGIIADIRRTYPDNVLQIMTYYENIEKYGFEVFAEKCHACGADAVLAPNIPEAVMGKLDEALAKYNIYNLRFAYYTLTTEQLTDLKANAKGYIFQQAVNGATGAQEDIDPQVKDKVLFLKEQGIQTPVFAGFGISKPEHVRAHVANGADGVIVGSTIISHIQSGDAEEYMKALTAQL